MSSELPPLDQLLVDTQAELIQAQRERIATLEALCRRMLPGNLCVTNRNIPDSMVVPLNTTMGELRAIAAAVARDK